jgi:hypothetical protein
VKDIHPRNEVGNSGTAKASSPFPGKIRRPFEAIAAHEHRRNKILAELPKAIQAYLESCSRARDVEWDRVQELLGSACRAFYDSLATSYLEVEPPIDPQQLFEMSGELFGGGTLSDFGKAITGIKVQSPTHWPPLQMWRDRDSLEQIREWTEISKDLNKDFRLGPHLDGGWLNDWVWDGAKEWRPQFERRFAKFRSVTAKADSDVAAPNPTAPAPETEIAPTNLHSISPAGCGAQAKELRPPNEEGTSGAIDAATTVGGPPEGDRKPSEQKVAVAADMVEKQLDVDVQHAASYLRFEGAHLTPDSRRRTHRL